MTNKAIDKKLATFVAVACSLLFLYTCVFGQFIAIVHRAFLLMFGLAMTFLDHPFVKKEGHWTRWLDYLLVVLTIVTCGYPILSWRDIVYRAGEAMPWDWYIALVLILLLFEACRRVMGLAMPIISVCSLIYAFFGPYMPSVIAHRGFTPQQMLSTIFLTTEGIWGTATGVGSSVIIYFLIFTAFLSVTGANDGFLQISQGLLGRVRGGPAKMAVVASGLFGTISGSAPANVAGTGSITIPLMKKIGYRPEFAGAVEAVASSGGQLVPPVMGSAAFIMAEVLGIKYSAVCKSAIVPALLYYVSCFFMVELESRRHGLKGLPPEEVPIMRQVLKIWWPVLIPLVSLIGMLVFQMTPSRAAFISLVLLWVVSFMRPETKLTPKKFVDGLVMGARDMAPISVVCGVAGIIIGVLGRTGLGTKLAEVIVGVSGGHMIIILILTMITSIIMGMGLPTVACYILLALSVAPAISKAGALPIAAHMFVFYFGIISAITPPVAIASYTASGIARADLHQLSWIAVKMAMPAFILPFMFVYGPGILLIGNPVDIIIVCLFALIGVLAMAISLHGFLWGDLNKPMRVILGIASLYLIYPTYISDAIGVVLAVIALGWHYTDCKKKKSPWLDKKMRASL
ncbi:MAG: TRAP transporter permease [Clostridiaceae bacterium]|jgi:TRAP transporter 4TM/12TM fusion protein|nr:TRAP transporter permease [Clostridiaceae bacterium]